MSSRFVGERVLCLLVILMARVRFPLIPLRGQRDEFLVIEIHFSTWFGVHVNQEVPLLNNQLVPCNVKKIHTIKETRSAFLFSIQDNLPMESALANSYIRTFHQNNYQTLYQLIVFIAIVSI